MVVRMFVKINFSSFFQAALAAFFPSASGSCSFFPSEAFFYFIMSWVGILAEMVASLKITQNLKENLAFLALEDEHESTESTL